MENETKNELITEGSGIMKLMSFSINDILTYFFGNRVRIVTVSRLHAFMKLEKKLLFNGFEKLEVIENFCGAVNIESVKTFRTKDIESPEIGYHRFFEKERITRFYDH
jgi:hypothetical protein